jgi:hypothetical protein
MKLHLEWMRPVPLRDPTDQNLSYGVTLEKLPATAGVYVFGRRWGNQFEALYVGKAQNVRHRVKGQLNNISLVQHLRNAKGGKRILVVGHIVTKPGQPIEKCLRLTERVLIRYFLSEGHDLVNKMGTRLLRHELRSSGRHPRGFVPTLMYIEKRKSE